MGNIVRMPLTARRIIELNREKRIAEEVPLLAEIEALKQKLKQGESVAAERMRGSHGEGLELPKF